MTRHTRVYQKSQFQGKGIWFFIPVALFIFAMMALSTVKVFFRKQEIQQRLDALQQEAVTLELKNKELQELVDFFNSEEFLSLQAKNLLGMKFPGEEVVAITDMPNAGENLSPPEDQYDRKAPTPIKSRYGNLNTWWEYFFE